MTDTTKPTGLALLREPIPANLISKMAKGTKQQEKCADDMKVYCEDCRSRHALGMQHYDFVGHAATTHILLDADPAWEWKPFGLDSEGLPAFDASGGLWIWLTVCSVTRPGYGNAPKRANAAPGDREKEVIGDALRNAAMRFGLALDLWTKADLRADPEDDDEGEPPAQVQQPRDVWIRDWVTKIKAGSKAGEVRAACAAAVAEAAERGDQDATGHFYVAEADRLAPAREKAAQAKAAAKAPAPELNRVTTTESQPVVFDESDIPH
jgi:hypothetical protein